MTEKFTPGPWEIEEDGSAAIMTARRFLPSDLGIIAAPGDPDEGTARWHVADAFSEEDANLIAAAPDMYDALDRARWAVARAKRYCSDCGTNDKSCFCEAAVIIDAALVKARGES